MARKSTMKIMTREEWDRRKKKKGKVGMALTRLGKIFKMKKYS